MKKQGSNELLSPGFQFIRHIYGVAPTVKGYAIASEVIRLRRYRRYHILAVPSWGVVDPKLGALWHWWQIDSVNNEVPLWLALDLGVSAGDIPATNSKFIPYNIAIPENVKFEYIEFHIMAITGVSELRIFATNDVRSFVNDLTQLEQ